MISLHNLAAITKRPAKRRGRGYGSGKGGHTVGRGSKGQLSRGKVGLLFEGTKSKKSLLKRLPIWRGKSHGSRFRKVTVTTGWLEENAKVGQLVDYRFLRRRGKVGRTLGKDKVKVVRKGKLKKALRVALPVSQSAARAIKAAKGKIIASPVRE